MFNAQQLGTFYTLMNLFNLVTPKNILKMISKARPLFCEAVFYSSQNIVVTVSSYPKSNNTVYQSQLYV